MPFGPRRTQKEIEEIKEKIAAAITQGFTDKVIYKQLLIPERTYYRYYDEIAQDLKAEHLSKTNRIIYSFVSRSMRRIRDLQEKYAETKDPSALRNAQAIEDSIMEIYKDLGILEKAPEKMQIEAINVTYKEPEFLKKKEEKKDADNRTSGPA